MPVNTCPAEGERARLEHCPECGCTDMKNNIYIRRGDSVKVYVRCSSCGAYVARYIISGYTSAKHYESFLHSLRFTRMSSGARMLRKMDDFAEDIEKEYAHVIELVSQCEDQDPIEKIIEEEYPDTEGSQQAD